MFFLWQISFHLCFFEQILKTGVIYFLRYLSSLFPQFGSALPVSSAVKFPVLLSNLQVMLLVPGYSVEDPVKKKKSLPMTFFQPIHDLLGFCSQCSQNCSMLIIQTILVILSLENVSGCQTLCQCSFPSFGDLWQYAVVISPCLFKRKLLFMYELTVMCS